MVTGSGDLTAQLSGFAASGHLILPGFLPADLVARLTPEVDHWVDSGLRQRSIDAALRPAEVAPPERVELDLEAHGELAVFPPLLDLLSHPALLGPSFVFHYLHSDRRPANGPGKSWHREVSASPTKQAAGWRMSPHRRGSENGSLESAWWITRPRRGQRFLLASAPGNVSAGEDIRNLTRAQAERLRLPEFDFWLFDSTIVARLVFDEGDTTLGVHVTEDPAEVLAACQARDAAWHHAVPTGEFAREVASTE